ncbi:unnamed protein product [Linum tenue]|uniref:Prolyl 4-hydroxylase alpha subunit domain-containing protein n=1 Tax=Linum tenue TaxID=586396 RepID=A0AAV0J6I3_9ROSI|nr:unnamed protein product [Linum tenue]
MAEAGNSGGGARKRKMADKKDAGGARKLAPNSNWPAIKSKKNLQITRLKDSDLFTVPEFLSATESKAFIRAAESIGFVHQGSLGPTMGEAYRDNDRISVNDPVLASTLWDSGLSKLFSDIKIRGKVGQRFGRHIDESADIGDGKRTYYTLLIYLSGSSKAKASKSELDSQKDASMVPLVGGETVFYGWRNNVVAEVAPAEGMALLHIHGDKCMLHEARNVSKGMKYVFRSDVAFA